MPQDVVRGTEMCAIENGAWGGGLSEWGSGRSHIQLRNGWEVKKLKREVKKPSTDLLLSNSSRT